MRLRAWCGSPLRAPTQGDDDRAEESRARRCPRCRPLGAALTAVLAGLAACRGLVVRETAPLRVEACDPGTAERWLGEANRLRARILTELASLSPTSAGRTSDARPISIRILEPGRTKDWHPLTEGVSDGRKRFVEVRGGERDLDLTLAHELAHLCIGADWKALPPAAQEGFVSLLAARAVDGLARERARRAEALMWPLGGLCLDIAWQLPGGTGEALLATTVVEYRPPDAFSNSGPPPSLDECLDDPREITPQSVDPYLTPIRYAVGFVLMERIVARVGLFGLHQVCVEAVDSGLGRVASSRLLELAAGPAPVTDVDFRTLALWLWDGWDEPTQRTWLAMRAAPIAPFIAEAIGWTKRGPPPGATSEERRAALDRWQVRISVARRGLPRESIATVSLDRVPELATRVASLRETTVAKGVAEASTPVQTVHVRLRPGEHGTLIFKDERGHPRRAVDVDGPADLESPVPPDYATYEYTVTQSKVGR